MATAPRRPPPIDPRHPTATAFLDETGIISQDRYFTVGLLILRDAQLIREVQKFRDRHHWYGEIKWVDVTNGSYPLYAELLDTVVASNARFACFVSDRDIADPVKRFGGPWRAYERLSAQLVIGASRKGELISLMADNYSSPDKVHFERDVKRLVNDRLGELCIATCCRLDSASSDGLQMVDLLTGAVTFEFRQQAGLAGTTSAKARLSKHLLGLYGVSSFVGQVRTRNLNIAIYRDPPKSQVP